MSLNAKYRIALQIIQNSDSDDLEFLKQTAQEIQDAEDDLLRTSEKLMVRCKQECQGICCRNLYLDAVITEWDFLFILFAERSMNDIISACLKKENLFFTSDCVFLQNGVGPCIFPSHSMPQVCITTFCSDETSVKKEIRRVKQKFFKLSCFRVFGTYRSFKYALRKIAACFYPKM